MFVVLIASYHFDYLIEMEETGNAGQGALAGAAH